MSIKDKAMCENPRAWSHFEMCTKDFKSIKITKYEGENSHAYKVNYLDVDYVHPYMIYIIFVKFLGFKHTYKPMEKVLYEIPFQYQDYYCMFSMKKFGLNFIINSKDEGIIRAIFKKIKSASRIAERLLKPIITESIDNGNVTIENRSSILRERYLYFREMVNNIILDQERGKYEGLERITGVFNKRSEMNKKIFFNTQAMLDAYFSFQEHILILLLPFTNIDFKEKSITHLINANWTTKFNEVFLPDKYPELMKHFDNLRRIKELRNKYTHGGFEKDKGSIFPHVEGVGAIPGELPSDSEEMFTYLSIKDVKFKKACEIIDDFESYLSNSNWVRPINILEYGIDMRFDKDYILSLETAIKSDENLESFLKYESCMYDREANMDW